MKWFFLLLVLLSYGCNTHSPENAIISGAIEGAEGQFIYLEKLTVNDLIRIDSVIMEKNGRFVFSYAPIETGFYLLKMENGDKVTYVSEKASKLELHADTSTFPDIYEITGNEESEILRQYFLQTARNQATLDSLSRIFRSSTHLRNFYEIKAGLDSAFAELFKDQQELVRKTVEDNSNSLAALLLFNQRFASKVLLSPETDFDLMLQIDSCVSLRYPGNMHVVAHHERILDILENKKQEQEAKARLAPGQPVPNLNLPDPSGKYISLNSLKGKYVLIYFWASYSPPCRAANIQLKEVYNKYKSKGLEIYAVSLDHNKKIWKDVIVLEKSGWINVSDLQGMASPLVKLYNLPDDLPYYYLIDKEGNIMTKNEKIPDFHSIF